MMKLEEKIFSIPVNKYVSNKTFEVYRPSSINNSQNNSVIFLMGKMKDKNTAFYQVRECLIFWQKEIEVPEDIKEKHAIVLVEEPRLEYCRFFEKITLQISP